MDELVSIIVPVYNRFHSLEHCVSSVAAQTYPNLHIILVDDGSNDGSGDLCDALAQSDARIEVVHRPNGGVSAARNTGLGRVRGSWISFVDSDDYIAPYYIEDMLAAAGGEDCDIIICGRKTVSDNREKAATFRRHTHTRYITGREAAVRSFGKDTVLFNECTHRLIRARLWAGPVFPEGKINEDLYASHSLIYRAGRIAISDAVLYAVVQSPESITRGTFTPRRLDVLDAWQEAVRFYGEAGEPGLVHIAARVYCSRVFDARCVCKSFIPHEREVLRSLRRRAAQAYKAAKPIRGYIDCNSRKALAYRLKLFLGRWCIALYALLFVRGREYI